MGISSSRQRSDSKTNETTEGTQMPVAPDWLTGAAQEYVGRIGAFGQMDPNSFVAQASPLQRAAWDNAGSLSGWQGQARAASELAQGAANRFSPMARPATYDQAMTSAYGYNPPEIQRANAPNASLVSGQGYAMPNLPYAQGYAAARVGSPIGAQAQGYQSQNAGAATIAPTANATGFGYGYNAVDRTAIGDSARVDDPNIARRIGNFQNPYMSEVVDTSLADFDRNAGMVRAQQAAQAARSGAFGGSRLGIREAQTEGELARARASTGANLRARGFETAAGLAGQEAGMAQQAGMFNAGAANDRNLAQASLDASRNAQNAQAANAADQYTAGIRSQASMFNAGAENQRSLAQAQLGQQAGLFNADAANQAAQFRASAGNQASLFNAGAGNQFALTQAGMDNDSSRYSADMNNQFNLTRAGMEQRANEFNAGAANTAALSNQQAQNAMGLAGYQGDLQGNLAEAGMRADASQFGAAAQNQVGLANQAAQNQARQFNAGAENQIGMFNAGLENDAIGRQLQAAGLLGSLASDYAGNTRADLGLMSQMGAEQRGIEQQYAMSPLAQLQAMGQLSGMTPYDILVGRQMDSTTTGRTQGTQTSSPSLFNQMLAAGQLASSFF